MPEGRSKNEDTTAKAKENDAKGNEMKKASCLPETNLFYNMRLSHIQGDAEKSFTFRLPVFIKVEHWITCDLIDKLKKCFMSKNVLAVFTVPLDNLSVAYSIGFNSFVECLLCYASKPSNQGTFEFFL